MARTRAPPGDTSSEQALRAGEMADRTGHRGDFTASRKSTGSSNVWTLPVGKAKARRRSIDSQVGNKTQVAVLRMKRLEDFTQLNIPEPW
ncbi:hypothetical protein [Burkholderia paludis]|uniref:hypothetical protein n=1 Tax=Burkholderia paludis TaxID=1506587 RepID=UPI00126A1061|nr:hypothetical protein [Burkholderia paludis]